MGRGAVSERDPLWHGVLPNSRATEPVIKTADVILAVGGRFAHRSTQGLLLNLSFDPSQTLIHLDLDPTVIGRLFKAQLPIVGDAKDGLTRLLEGLGSGPARSVWDHRWRESLRPAASARYTREIAHLIGTLRAALPDDAIVVNDQTGINYWMEWRFPVLMPRTFLYPVGSATLGYAVEQFFENGGWQAVIVRVANGARAPTLRLPAGKGELILQGRHPGPAQRPAAQRDELRTDHAAAHAREHRRAHHTHAVDLLLQREARVEVAGDDRDGGKCRRAGWAAHQRSDRGDRRTASG